MSRPATVRDDISRPLHQLSALQLGDGASVTLAGWSWHTQNTQAARSAMSTQRGFCFGIEVGGEPLTDGLRLVLQAPTHVAEQVVGGLSLQSEHSAERWPWERLTFNAGGSMTELLRLPDPASYQGPQPPVLCALEDWRLTEVTEVSTRTASMIV